MNGKYKVQRIAPFIYKKTILWRIATNKDKLSPVHCIKVTVSDPVTGKQVGNRQRRRHN